MPTTLKTLHRLAVADGIALLLLLFVAVPLKHRFDYPLGVTLLGPVHGALFLSLSVTLLTALSRGAVKPALAALLFIGALVPLGAFYADHKLRQASGDI
jgi:integral membrane protein